MPGNSQIQLFNDAGCQYVAQCPGADWTISLTSKAITETRFTQNLATGALAGTTALAIAAGFELAFVAFAASQAITETFTVWLDALGGATYDSVLTQRNLNNQRYDWFSQPGLSFINGSQLRVACTNAGLAGIVYVTVATIAR